jgi:hypothetical protein
MIGRLLNNLQVLEAKKNPAGELGKDRGNG